MKNTIKSIFKNLPGWRTRRQIIAFESDDWGSLRIPSLESKQRLLEKNITFNLGLGFDDYDSLESENDLTSLFSILQKYKDTNGKHPIFTANIIVANPDFAKIRDSGYTEYHYESVSETFKRFPKCENSFDIWLQGSKDSLFYPQFHAREHLNVPMWLNSLRENFQGAREAFDECIWSNNIREDVRGHHLAAYDYNTDSEREFILRSIVDGLNLFESLLGYKSLSTMAPCYLWSDEVTQQMVLNGVQYFQSGTNQRFPEFDKRQSKNTKKFHFTGQKGQFGEIYLQRNVYFEPAYMDKSNIIDNCISSIRTAFLLGKPAIIQSHRLNYLGELHPSNRKNSLQLLDELLNRILKKFPNIEFMTSVELGNLIKNE